MTGIPGTDIMTDLLRHCTLAVGAHPDDIEFMMAGTLLLLKDTGMEIHMWNLSSGNCGSDSLTGEEITDIRWKEARASAHIAGATLHLPITDDIDIFYEKPLITRIAAVIRRIHPLIILVPSPEDYMEDHQNTSRLVVTAAFVRGMRNYMTSPPEKPWNGHTVLYHAMPHGLTDGMRKRIRAEYYINITSVIDRKRSMLSMHTSQQEWLDHSQGEGSYQSLMESMAEETGAKSGRFEFAEGWRRHSHLGFCPPDHDPLGEFLGSSCWIDPEYTKSLG